MEEFYRIRRLPPYVFEQVNRAKAVARNGGADIIDLGMGNPDLPTPAHVVEKLKETVGKPRTDRYSASKGIPGLRRAQAAYYARRFGVKLNPDTQVVTTLGSKEGFANVAQAITAPGDIIIVPNPTYPIHVFGFLMAGGAIRSVPVEADDKFFGALERAVLFSIPKPIAVVVCYPSNPTACVASLDFYRELIAFAKKHSLLVLSDLAYAEVYFDDNPPPSVLQVPGAMDVAVEFTSMSKTFSMPGWRIGFAVGNERIIAALGAGEILSRLRRVHADPGRGDGRAQWPRRLHQRDARDLSAPPRRAGGIRSAGPAGPCRRRRLRCSPGRRSPSRSSRSAASNSPRCWSRRPASRCRPAPASASTAKAMCASRWSRTSSASARPRATSGAFLKQGRKCCTTSFPWRRGVSRASLHFLQVGDVLWLSR